MNNSGFRTRQRMCLALAAVLLSTPGMAREAVTAGELAALESAMALGGGMAVGIESEFKGALLQRFPEDANRYRDMNPTQRGIIIDLFRDTGHLPTVVAAIRKMPGPFE